MTETTFNVHDRVVYPAHGVGEITAQEIEIIAGFEMPVYVISFEKAKMTLRVPVKRSKEAGLRHLSTHGDIAKALAVLQSRPKPAKGMWSRRAQEYESKINSGSLLAVCEVIRDLHKNVDDPDRSYSERVIYEAALARVTGEIAAVEKVEISEVEDRLVNVLRQKKAA